MYKPEEKPLNPTPEPGNAWERVEQREAALEARIAKLEHDLAALQAYCDLGLQQRLASLDGLVDELMHAMERARIPRYPG